MEKQEVSEAKQGDLRVWWIPQVPGKAFRADVASPAEAKKLMDVLAQYDIFQFENRIKPDYSNAGGLECFNQDGDSPEWCDWYDPESGEGIDDWTPTQDGAK